MTASLACECHPVCVWWWGVGRGEESSSSPLQPRQEMQLFLYIYICKTPTHTGSLCRVEFTGRRSRGSLHCSGTMPKWTLDISVPKASATALWRCFKSCFLHCAPSTVSFTSSSPCPALPCLASLVSSPLPSEINSKNVIYFPLLCWVLPHLLFLISNPWPLFLKYVNRGTQKEKNNKGEVSF